MSLLDDLGRTYRAGPGDRNHTPKLTPFERSFRQMVFEGPEVVTADQVTEATPIPRTRPFLRIIRGDEDDRI